MYINGILDVVEKKDFLAQRCGTIIIILTLCRPMIDVAYNTTGKYRCHVGANRQLVTGCTTITFYK